MQRHLIVKNAKFNSKTSDKIIRIKEVDDQFAIIENVKHVDGRYKAIAGSQRVIEVSSIQKAYFCGDASTLQARVQKNKVYEAGYGRGCFVRVLQVSNDKVMIQNGYQQNGKFNPIVGSVRQTSIQSLIKNYKEVK